MVALVTMVDDPNVILTSEWNPTAKHLASIPTHSQHTAFVRVQSLAHDLQPTGRIRLQSHANDGMFGIDSVLAIVEFSCATLSY